MEESEELYQTPPETPRSSWQRAGLYVTDQMRIDWSEIFKWAIFMAGYGLISILIPVVSISRVYDQILELFSSTPLLNDSLPLLSFLIQNLVAVAVVFIVVLLLIYLFHLLFALKIRQALRQTDQEAFQLSWQHLLNHFRLFSIVIIVGMVLYLAIVIEIYKYASSLGGGF